MAAECSTCGGIVRHEPDCPTMSNNKPTPWSPEEARMAAARFQERAEADERMGLGGGYDAALAATLEAYASHAALLAECREVLREELEMRTAFYAGDDAIRALLARLDGGK